MNAALSQQVNQLFEAVLDLPSGERAAFLDRECGNPAVRSEVESLLAHASQVPESFLATPILEPGTEPATVQSLSQGVGTVDDVNNPTVANQPAGIPGFQILQTLGKGGMGVVYQARDLKLPRLVALKMIRAGSDADERERQRFQSEAAAVAQLVHPNIVQIHDIGEHAGQPFFVLEYVEGGTLGQRIKGTMLPPMQAAEIMVLLARAVQAAHQRGIIHRDLKPANVLLTADGTPKITDFGLAKHLDADQALSQAGDIMGTPPYMAPEQAAGRISEIGPGTDIHALGAILYELLTGRAPFQGESTLETLEQVRNKEPEAPRKVQPAVPRDLETICLKCLRKESSHRYASALALAQDLERFLAGEAILARPEGALSKLKRKARRHAVALLLMALVLTALTAGGVIVYRSGHLGRVETLVERLQDQLEETTWTEAKISEHERLLGELAERAPDRLELSRQRFHESLKQSAFSRLQQNSAVGQDERDYVNRMILVLSERSPETANALKGALQDRDRNWDIVFQLPASNTSNFDLRRFQREPRVMFLTRQPSQGNVRIEATWNFYDHTTQLGVALHSDAERNMTGYVFLVEALEVKLPGAPPGPPGDFSAIRQGKGQLQLKIIRNGVLLRRTEFSAGNHLGKTLKMTGEREGDRLRFYLNDNKVLEARDVVPLAPRGFFGLVCPNNTGLASLVGRRQALPTKPGKLEFGDELFAQGKFREAQQYYATQRIQLLGTTDGFEARYKNALALDALDQKAEALREYEAMVKDSGATQSNQWVFLATFQLWADFLRNKKFVEAEELSAKLIAERERDKGYEFIKFVPEETVGEIIQGFRESITGLGYWEHNETRLHNIKQLVQIEELLGIASISQVRTRQAMLRALRVEGQRELAIFVVSRWLKELPDDDPAADLLVAEFAWLMRDIGTPRSALDQLDRRLFTRTGEYRPGMTHLLVERIRIFAAAQDWKDAEHDINEFLRVHNYTRTGDRNLSDVHLLLGFIRQKQGDSAGASSAWRKGKYQGNPSDPALRIYLAGGMGLISLMMAETLCQELDPAYAEAILRNFFTNYPRFGTLFQFAGSKVVAIMVPIANRMWKSEQGKVAAEKMVFQTCSFREYIELPTKAFVREFVQSEALTAPITMEQDVLLQTSCDEGIRAFSSGKVSQDQAMKLALLWNSGPGFLRDITAVKGLDPSLRAPAGYFFGLRMLRLGKPAEDYFKLAQEATPPCPVLQRLAQVELDRLKQKPK